jgi:hypothetical protein
MIQCSNTPSRPAAASQPNPGTSGTDANPRNTQEDSGTGRGATEFASGFFGRARRVVARATQGASSSRETSSSDGAAAKQDLVTRLRKEVAEAVLPMATHPSFMKRRTDVEAVEIQVGEGPADLVISVCIL